MGPADQDMEWTQDGIEGMARFVRRLWRVVQRGRGAAPAGPTATARSSRKAHQTIQRVTDDLDRRMQFHTPISAVMELVNDLADDTAAPGARFAAETAVSLLQPWAPHVAEELWERLGQRAPVGAAVARGRPGAARPRHLRARHPGERQGARPDRGAGRPSRGRAGRAREVHPRRCRRTWTGRRSARRSSCPGKLVNLVVG